MTNSRWEVLLDGWVKRALFWSPLRPYLLHKYRYAFTPAQRYWAIDTFGGGRGGDVSHERQVRGKDSAEERRALDKIPTNSRRWFEANLKENGITRVRTHAAAMQDFAFPADTRLCFVLLDVDLYLPTVAGLEKVWPLLAPGGLVVVDDCQADHVYDGSRQAVAEFCARHGMGHELVETKLAVLRKPPG